MKKIKIFDCITFNDENLLTNTRFEILNKYVDYFIICESKFDHKGNKKNINFNLNNYLFKDKVRHIIINEKFPDLKDGWEIEAYQREKIFDQINDADEDDLILYSDSDEIPNPNKLKNLSLEKRYGIFMQNFYVYKINIFNPHETPWEGTRVCRKRDLKSFTHLRKKILKKNINKGFWKFNIEKNIEIINDGGWHFNNLYTVEKISKKLKTFQHIKFSDPKYSSEENIRKKINKLEDLFDRNHKYKIVDIDHIYPDYILNNLNLFKDHIL